MFDLIGKTLGPYRILEQLGAGGMATVYKAYQPNMDRYIAIKVLPTQFSRDPDFTKRFQREARAISRLEHSHILPVYDYGEYEGITYIAMRYIKAGTLKDRMSTGRLALDEINHLISQIGSALDYAHRMGVIHRDVKPANVLLDDQADVYLSDFGLARMMEPSQELTESGVGLGTPAYMSPEQGQGMKLDHRSDIYSLGIILYEMLTGRVPYESETPMAVVFQHIQGDLALPRTINPNIPELVERVVLKALAKEPADRYQTAGELAQAVNAAVRMMSAEEQGQTLADQPVRIRQDISIVTRLQGLWTQRRGKIMLLSGAVTAFLFLGFLTLQLPGKINILVPNANQENAPVPTPTLPIATQQETPQSTTQVPSLPVPEGELVFDENFDDGVAHGIYIGGDEGSWQVVNDDATNKVFEVRTPSSGWPGIGFLEPSAFSDGTIEYRVKWIETSPSADSGSVGLDFRVGSGKRYTFFLVPFEKRTQLMYEGPDATSTGIIDGGLATYSFDNNVWYNVRLDVQGSRISAYINGILVSKVQDSHLTTGHLTMGVGPKTTAYIDNIRIFSISNEAGQVPATSQSRPGKLVFDENFDDGIPNGISVNSNTKWKMVDDHNGSKLFQIDNKPGDWAGFGLDSTNIANGLIEYKIRVVDYDLSSGGAIDCSFRVTSENTYVSYLAVVTKNVSFDYQGVDTNDKMVVLENASAPYILEKNIWYTVKIDVKGNEFTIYIDGKKALSATDDRIKSGRITFGVAPNTVAQFDDLRVWVQP